MTTSTWVQGSCPFHCCAEMTAEVFGYSKHNNFTNHSDHIPLPHRGKIRERRAAILINSEMTTTFSTSTGAPSPDTLNLLKKALVLTYSHGQKFPSTLKEHVQHSSLHFQWFLQLCCFFSQTFSPQLGAFDIHLQASGRPKKISKFLYFTRIFKIYI